MSSAFSERFKQLRKKSDLTQEQVAEIFHVSPQSVSRWETGSNYPDTDMLPHIAIFFKVTVDDLLGTQRIAGEEQTKEYTLAIRSLFNSGQLYQAIDMARKACKEYPLHVGLHYHFVQALSTACSEQTPGFAENTEKYRDEIIAICERIILLSDYKTSLGHRVQLLKQYAAWGMKAEAKKVLETLPTEIWDSQEPWVGLVLEGEEWRKNQQHRILRARYLLEYLIRDYLAKAGLSTMQKIEFRQAKIQIESLIDIIAYDDPESSLNHLEIAEEYMLLAESFCDLGDKTQALEYVAKATTHALHHTEVMDAMDEEGSGYIAWSTPRNLPWILWQDHLLKPAFDGIRNEKDFIASFELLQANSRELK